MARHIALFPPMGGDTRGSFTPTGPLALATEEEKESTHDDDEAQPDGKGEEEARGGAEDDLRRQKARAAPMVQDCD